MRAYNFRDRRGLYIGFFVCAGLALGIGWGAFRPRDRSIMEGALRHIPVTDGGLPKQLIPMGHLDEQGLYGFRSTKGHMDISYLAFVDWTTGSVTKLEAVSAKIRATKGGYPEISPDGRLVRWHNKRDHYTSRLDGGQTRQWRNVQLTNRDVMFSWLSDSRYWVQAWKETTGVVTQSGGEGEYRALIYDHAEPQRKRTVSLGNLSGGCGPMFPLSGCKLLIFHYYQPPGDRFKAVICDVLAEKPTSNPVEFQVPYSAVERTLSHSGIQSPDLNRVAVIGQHTNPPESEIVIWLRSVLGSPSNRRQQEFTTLIGRVDSMELKSVIPPDVGKDSFQFKGWMPDGRRCLMVYQGWLWSAPVDD